ncbi:DNA-binding response OmpR family regulator [Geobacillus thermodenitrificans]|uniref:response regulator transcription factor n=1 Tax=Geobacillus thermodenitrificans TaxID=33940 RepID=UPI002E0AF1F2|nr:DNA-binding response OmpR family regulator [Geobacillus thermodenitrificans]
MSKLLLVEDDESLALGIEFALQDEGYEVCRASTLEEGKALFASQSFDLIILDINLPDGSGYDLCKHIRATSNVPILFLTALDEEVNIILGLELGGDDYITKPFGVGVFLSRIKALLRRSTGHRATGMILKSGTITVDPLAATVEKNGQKISLSAQEYKLLLTLRDRPCTVMSRDEILRELAEGTEAFFDENTLAVYIRRLQEKIEDDPKEPQYIVTQRGLGYKWNKEVTREKIL